MAEKDMAIIRSKRATNQGVLNAGAPKGKYRKRSVCPCADRMRAYTDHRVQAARDASRQMPFM